MAARREASAGSRLSSAAPGAGVLPRVFTEGLSAVLLADTVTRRVVPADRLAQQLAPWPALPASGEAWSNPAGLRDAVGRPVRHRPPTLARGLRGPGLRSVDQCPARLRLDGRPEGTVRAWSPARRCARSARPCVGRTGAGVPDRDRSGRCRHRSASAGTNLTLAAGYLPAGQANQVGGNWWDVFARPDGATGIAVGDVTRHGLAAAAATGQLRSDLRTCACAVGGEDPATVLDQMDSLVQDFDMAQLATCIYARLQPPDGPEGGRRTPRPVWSDAGHLPPVVLAPAGTVRLLTGAIGAPIGVPAIEYRSQQRSTPPVGTTVSPYADGLIETRGGDIDSGVQRLLALVATHRPADGPQALVDRVLSNPAALTDDVALLAAQVLLP